MKSVFSRISGECAADRCGDCGSDLCFCECHDEQEEDFEDYSEDED